MTKRYAVMMRNLSFDNLPQWFDKAKDKWVEQKSSEEATVRAYERKYGVKLSWNDIPVSDEPNARTYKGYQEVK